MQTTIILAGSIDGSTDGNIKLPINIDDIEEEGFAD